MSGSYRSYCQFVLLLLALAAVLLLLGFVVTRRLGGAEAVVGMLWGCGLSLLAAALGGLLPVVGKGSSLDATVLVLGSLAIRMGVTLIGVLAILLSLEVSPAAFLLWVVIAYLSFLVADVVFFVSRSKAS